MKRTVRAGSREADLELSFEPGQLRALVSEEGTGGQQLDWQVSEIEPGLYSILHGLRSIEARVWRNHSHWVVEIDGKVTHVEVDDPRELRKGFRHHARVGQVDVTAPMPGKVVRLLVAEGDVVEEGQGLVVVEAMKMQNEMKAPKDGKVVALGAKEGTSVAAGEVLLTLE